jgi:hypothetical protein
MAPGPKVMVYAESEYERGGSDKRIEALDGTVVYSLSAPGFQLAGFACCTVIWVGP